MVSVTENGENMRDSAAIGLSVAGLVATVLSRYSAKNSKNIDPKFESSFASKSSQRRLGTCNARFFSNEAIF